MLSRIFPLNRGEPLTILDSAGEPVSVESDIVRVVSLGTTEIFETTRLKILFSGRDTLKGQAKHNNSDLYSDLHCIHSYTYQSTLFMDRAMVVILIMEEILERKENHCGENAITFSFFVISFQMIPI